MKIIVCIKQVPESNNVKFDPVTHNLVRSGTTGRINPFDKNAIEAALQLRDAIGGSVSVLTMGPPAATEALRDGLAMGADDGYLLSSRAFGGADTLATGYTVAAAINKIGGVDLTLFGRQAVDADTGQVGPITAELLGVPQATFVNKITPDATGGLTVQRDLDDRTQTVALTTPAVITVRSEINHPRYETPVNIQDSFTKTITTWTEQDLSLDPAHIGLAGSPTVVTKVYAPTPTQRAARPLTGTPDEAVDQLIAQLQRQNLI